tara:strand:+ start:4419 stop:5024 length:606 start_codon:yes stop_codon:yes gene_type:complete
MIPIRMKSFSPLKTTLKKSIFITCIFLGSIATLGLNIFGNEISPQKALAGLEIQWDPDPNFKRLKYLSRSDEIGDRNKVFFFLRPRDRNISLLKISLKVPKNYKTKITTKKLSLCQVKIGGFNDRTRCIEQVPTIFEINEDQTLIEAFPAKPIPVSKKSYAIVMKVFNPRKAGMFQFHALGQSAGSLPISKYLGTWTLSVD